MKKKRSYIVNDLKLPLLFLVISSFVVFIIQKDFSCYDINKTYSAAVKITNNFTLTFTGFLITAFTILQVLESKQWFDQMKETAAFDALIWELEMAVFISILFLLGTSFLILFDDISSFISKSLIVKAITSILFASIVFIISVSWNCIKCLISLIRS